MFFHGKSSSGIHGRYIWKSENLCLGEGFFGPDRGSSNSTPGRHVFLEKVSKTHFALLQGVLRSHNIFKLKLI